MLRKLPQTQTIANLGRMLDLAKASGAKAAHPNARVVDASGGTILPGLTDAHGHLYGLGLALDADPSTLYRYFRGMDDLTLAILRS